MEGMYSMYIQSFHTMQIPHWFLLFIYRSSKTLSADGSTQIDDADDYVQDLSELDQLVRRQQQTVSHSLQYYL